MAYRPHFSTSTRTGQAIHRAQADAKLGGLFLFAADDADDADETEDPSLTAQVSAVETAVREKFATASTPYPDVYTCDVRTKTVVYQNSGKYYRAPWAIEGTVPKIGTPTEVVKKTEWESAFTFSAEAVLEFVRTEKTSRGEFAIRRGKVFEEGDYPDKGVSYTAADLYAAAAHFKPVRNDLEHKASVLDGHLGDTRSLVAEKNPTTGKVELYAESEVPVFLQKVFGDDPIKCSLAWSKGKRVVGNAFVRNPRIADAALFAAFTADTAHGQEKKPMKLKLSALMAGVAAAFAGNQDPDAEIDVSTFGEGGTPTPAKPALPAAAAPVVAFADSPEFKAMQAKLDAAENARLAAGGALFANNYATGTEARIYPNAVDFWAGQFAAAVKADAAAENVTYFSADGKIHETGPSVKLLKATLDAMPKLPLSGERLTGADVLPGAEFSGGGKTMDPAKREQLLSQTATGRAALAKEKKAS